MALSESLTYKSDMRPHHLPWWPWARPGGSAQQFLQYDQVSVPPTPPVNWYLPCSSVSSSLNPVVLNGLLGLDDAEATRACLLGTLTFQGISPGPYLVTWFYLLTRCIQTSLLGRRQFCGLCGLRKVQHQPSSCSLHFAERTANSILDSYFVPQLLGS